MMTGLLPQTALRSSRPLRSLGPWATTLAERLRALGFRTAAFTEDAWVSAGFGFARGFERYHEERGTEWSEETRGYSEVVFDRGLRWLTAHRHEPAFLFLHTYEVHAPYTLRSRFALDTPADGAPQSEVDSARYDGEIRYLDEQFGRFVAGLEERGMLDDIVLILTSDHGEEFGEHGRRYHGTHLYEETLAVPALFYAPGRLPDAVRRPGPMSVVDLTPTLLDLLGSAVPADLDGASFAAHLRDGAPVSPRALFHEAIVPTAVGYDGKDESWIAPAYGATVWPFRLTRIPTGAGPRYELYDLASDPHERTILEASALERFSTLRTRLDDYASLRSARRDQLAQRIRSEGDGEPGARRVDRAITRKLRALGYLQ